MLQRINKILYEKKGFTLIELMIVVAIIGILAAVAIPNFQNFRKRAYDSGAASEVGNARLAMESYFSDRNTYATALADLTAQMSNLASTANVTFAVSGGSANYTVVTYSDQGTKTYTATVSGVTNN